MPPPRMTRTGNSRWTTADRPVASAATASSQVCRAASSWSNRATTSAAEETWVPDNSPYLRTTDAADAIVSRQPRPPQPQRRPFGSTGRCPISPAWPAPPRSSRPPDTSAAAIPVPTETNARSSTPRPAPACHSASPAAVTSWSTATGTDQAAASSARNDRFRQPTLALITPTPRLRSTIPGRITPALAIPDPAVAALPMRSRPRSAIAFRAASPYGVATSPVSRTSPEPSTTSALIEVPPTSTARTASSERVTFPG